MPKGLKRETERHDIWFTDSDSQKLEIIAAEMKRRGFDPNGRFGKINPSKVIRWSLEQTCQILEKQSNT